MLDARDYFSTCICDAVSGNAGAFVRVAEPSAMTGSAKTREPGAGTRNSLRIENRFVQIYRMLMLTPS